MTTQEQAMDSHIGAEIQRLRIQQGMTRQELANQIGVTHQQLHKYETGTNRIAASRLGMLSKALGVEVAQFYDGFTPGMADEAKPFNSDVSQRSTLEVSRNFQRISDPKMRDAISNLVRILADKS